MKIQDFGVNFELKKLLTARDVAREITYELASLVTPGMTEADVLDLYKKILLKYPVEKQWHPHKFRLGPNTICSFKDVSVPYILKENDIFLIDIGPVVDGHEADFGETFTLGENPEYQKICEAQKTVFQEVASFWKETGATGTSLYEFAHKRAQAHGYLLNDNQDGHRIGDFPHHVFFKGGLAECREVVIPNAWILEIHLWDPQKRFGAFYEDVLTSD